MGGIDSPAGTIFGFSDRMKVEILQGNILAPGVAVAALVSSDDNYLTMGSGVSALLRKNAGSIDYVREAQARCPVKAGTVVVTRSYGLKALLGVDHVFHGAVIDYDSDVLRLPELVEQVTANCLEEADRLGLQSILLPALATGAGKLSMEECARCMCGAIKAYVAQERPVREIYILLYRPGEAEGQGKAGDAARYQNLNERFIREANLVLGVPYDPTQRIRQVRDFYGGEAALARLQEIITGQRDDEGGKHHAVILGGPFVGKWALLDHLHHLAGQPGSPLGAGRRLVKLTFGRVHEGTPTSFIYRKLLCALDQAEPARDPETRRLLAGIQEMYSDPELSCDRFLAFLDRHKDRYGEFVFLIDKLPRLLKMEDQAGEPARGLQAFWQDLDRLQTRVRFIYTARPADYQQLRVQRLDPYASAFQSRIEPIWVSGVTDEARKQWVDELFNRYLDRPGGAPVFVQDRFATEAGRHPYLISLFGHALVEALKRDALTNPKHPARYTREFMARFFQAACNAIEEPRRDFFELLMAVTTPDDREALETLAKAEEIEEKKRKLMRDLREGENQNAAAALTELQAQDDPRKQLNDNTLCWLEAQGYLIDVKKQAGFVAPSFGAWVAGYFGVGRRPEGDEQPQDVQISLLNIAEPHGPQAIRTMFRGRGARIVTAQKELRQEDKRDFAEAFGRCISSLLHPGTPPDTGWLQDVGQVGNFILTQFTTSEIKRYLQYPPPECTILFEVDDALKDIPWELMLETAYPGQIAFRVGRRVIGQQPDVISRVVRGTGKVKALLIGDPMGDLDAARAEVEWLANRLRNDERFAEPVVLLGANCQPLPILSALGSKQYGLIHYSGHTRFDGYRSAWQLADGKTITTDRLTSALQMGPPAFVFSSSCKSAAGGSPEPVRYENQTFDLPSAFLQAGVEAYIGTLWEVEATAARRFVVDFYEAFLEEAGNLGECLRRAKQARKEDGQSADRINWLSFILYGDPHLTPGELFPALKKQGK